MSAKSRAFEYLESRKTGVLPEDLKKIHYHEWLSTANKGPPCYNPTHVPENYDATNPQPLPEGVKYDTGKQDMTAIAYFPNALTAFAKVLDYGAKKYPSRDNWRKVPNLVPRYLAALVRHVFARIRGEILDPESGLPHLACAMCCIAFILEVEESK